MDELYGFRISSDAESLALGEDEMAAFSMPQECLNFNPPASSLVVTFKNGETERKIYMNTQLTADELQKINTIREMSEKDKIVFTRTVASMAGRFLNQAKGDCTKAYAAMQATDKWRKTFFEKPMRWVDVQEDFKHGICYWGGRDRELRPTIVVRGNRIPAKWISNSEYDKIIRLVTFCVEYFLRYMVVPGRIEGMNILVDLKGLGIWQVPVGALEQLYKTMGSHYNSRTFKFYIANMPWALKMLLGVAKKIVSERQALKMCVLDSVNDLRNDFALHQLEEDLGGTNPVAKNFFPFPLKAGPFEAGHQGGQGKDKVQDCHKILTRVGSLGRIWDPKKTAAENERREYTELAGDIFQKCNIPVPAECPSKEESKTAASKPAPDPKEKAEAAAPKATPKSQPEPKAADDKGTREKPTLPQAKSPPGPEEKKEVAAVATPPIQQEPAAGQSPPKPSTPSTFSPVVSPLDDLGERSPQSDTAVIDGAQVKSSSWFCCSASA